MDGVAPAGGPALQYPVDRPSFIVMAALSYVMGYSQGQEYAEPEWHLDLFLTILWVLYAVVYIGTVLMREEEHIYVANWFYMAFILTVAVLHLGNGASACAMQRGRSVASSAYAIEPANASAPTRPPIGSAPGPVAPALR